MSKIKTFNDIRDDLFGTDPYRAYTLETVGKIIAYRDRLGWSQQELAVRAHLPVEVVNEIENGEYLPSIEVINRLMQAVGFEWTLEEASGEDEG